MVTNRLPRTLVVTATYSAAGPPAPRQVEVAPSSFQLPAGVKREIVVEADLPPGSSQIAVEVAAWDLQRHPK